MSDLRKKAKSFIRWHLVEGFDLLQIKSLLEDTEALAEEEHAEIAIIEEAHKIIFDELKI